jgi:2-hydroxy-3-keto-5-methylthiopentenyl-1-phosphate phosphatase
MSMNKFEIIVFSDFDGTITSIDLGDEIFRKFGELEPYNSQLKSGFINVKQYWHLVCKTLKKDLTINEIEEFAFSAEIDSNFVNFANTCSKENWKLSIVSDGFEEYINPILKKHNLDYLQVTCNKLEKIGTSFIPVYSGASESCNCLSASCKRNVILNNSNEESILVYIGDGYSDYCAAEHCDVIFAKKNLATYLSGKKIPYHPFKNFFDVKRILMSIIENKKIKKRNQAFLLREKAFIYE